MPAQTTQIAAGELRDVAKIIDPRVVPVTQDTFGGLPATGQNEPALVADQVRCKIEFRGTGTFYSAQHDAALVSHTVTMRWIPGIVPEMQLYFLDKSGAAQLLQIKAVNDVDSRGKKLVLECMDRPDLLNEIDVVPGV